MQLDVRLGAPRDEPRRVSSVTFAEPCSASSCILYSDRYIRRANEPSTQQTAPDETAHQVAATV